MLNLKIINNRILFYISFGLFLVMTLLRSTFYYQYVMGTAFKAGLAFCVLLLLVNELIFGELNTRGVISIVICVVLVGLFFLVQVRQYKVMTATVLLIFAARKIPFQKIARFAAIISTLFLAFVIISAYLGIIPNFEGSRGETVRYYLGFLYSLFPATILTNITFLFIYYRKDNILWRELLILLAANYWIYHETDSRLSFILALAGICVSAFLKLKPDFFVRKKIFTFILAMAIIVCAVISIIVSIKYNSDIAWHTKANEVLSDRLSLQHEAFHQYGITVFGQDINANGNGLNPFGENPALVTEEYFYIDNEYIRWLLSYGIILFVLLIAIITVVCIKSRKYDKKGYLLIIFVLLAVQCTIQDSFLCFYYNTFLLAIGNVLIGKEDEQVLTKTRKKKHQYTTTFVPYGTLS